MAISNIDIGDRVRFSVVIEVDSAATNPTNLAFKWKVPGAVAITKTYPADAEVVQDSTGNFHIDKDITESGTHPYKWEATGTAVGAEEDLIRVKESVF